MQHCLIRQRALLHFRWAGGCTRLAVCAPHFQHRRYADTGDEHSATVKKRSIRRRVRPSDEQMAALVEDEDMGSSGYATQPGTATSLPGPLLAQMQVSPMSSRPTHSFGDAPEDGDDDIDPVGGGAMDECDTTWDAARHGKESDGGEEQLTSSPTSESPNHLPYPRLVDARITVEAQKCTVDGEEVVSQTLHDTTEEYIDERQQALYEAPVEELHDLVTSYLRATTSIKLVSAEEEHLLFPVLMARVQELTVHQMLDIVECHWPRSTLARYGTHLKDALRDRIAAIAVAAAQAAPPATGDEGGNAEQDALIFVHEARADGALNDPILSRASTEITAETVLRSIIVMGMSAGRRKRDLEFFQVMGMYVVHFINSYKDPHDLVRVLTAFARAKIVPPKSFLALLGRRFPVLNKRTRLEPLACYRALANYYRMGYDQMNPFRFFSDCIYASIDTKVKAMKRLQKRRELEKSLSEMGTQVTSETSGDPREGHRTLSGEQEDALTGCSKPLSTETATLDMVVKAMLAAHPCLATGAQRSEKVMSREWLRLLTGLKPSMFTKWLAVLARLGAPHQQYLRPLIQPVLVPILPFLPPPSFSRLLVAVRLFKTTDLELLEPVIDLMCERVSREERVWRADVLTMLYVLSHPDTPVPKNLTKFIDVCCAVFTRSISFSGMPEARQHAASAPADSISSVPHESTAASVPFVLRPHDMCTVAADLLRIQQKADVPLSTLEPLTDLMESFALRFVALLDLGVVSLTHLDIFTDICRQQQHPDRSGVISALVEKRKAIESADGGEDRYYSQLDIDVRDTFYKTLTINDTNTYGSFRPLPGAMQVDFRAALTDVSAFDLLEAVDLYERACPGALRPAPALLLTRGLLAKFGTTGEEVLTDGNRLITRPPRELLLTREDLRKFVALLSRTPLEKVRSSPLVWQFVLRKAQHLQLQEMVDVANSSLRTLSV